MSNETPKASALKTIITTPRRTNNIFSAYSIKPVDIKNARKYAEAGNPSNFFELLDHLRTLDPHLRGDLETRKLAVLSFDHEVQGEDDVQREFVKDVLKRIDYQSFASALLDGVYPGMRFVEMYYESAQGKWMPYAFDILDNRNFKSLDVKLVGEVRSILDVLLYKGADGTWAKINMPAGKIIVADYSDISYKTLPINFTRMGIGTTCMMYSLGKYFNFQDWQAFNEIFAIPGRVGKYKDGASKTDIENLENAVHNYGSDASAVISEMTEILFPEAQKYGSINSFESLETNCNKNISKAVLGETLTSDIGSNGSRAAAQVHDGVRIEKIRADAYYIKRIINQQLIQPLLSYNFAKPDPSVMLNIPVKEAIDLEKTSRVIREIFEMEVPISLSQIQEIFGLRPVAEGEETIQKKSIGGIGGLLS